MLAQVLTDQGFKTTRMASSPADFKDHVLPAIEKELAALENHTGIILDIKLALVAVNRGEL